MPVDNGANLSVNKLVFLATRVDNKNSATLVSSGPHGHIHFWNVFTNGFLMAHFSAVTISLSADLFISCCSALTTELFRKVIGVFRA